MASYDANVRVNVTVEYARDDLAEGPSDVKADLETAFEGFDTYFGGAHVWVTEVLSTGRPGRID